MPLPLVLGVGAAIAGAAGVGAGVNGAVKMKKANDKMKSTEKQHEKNITRFEVQSEETTAVMDELGLLELNILKSFEGFSELIEKIQNRPEFQAFEKDGVEIPKYDKEKLKSVSVGAGALLGGISGAAAGTAGGFAAAGAAASAVMALGTASTGTAISTLSGVALTNATLAALGGGSLAAGGGGMALGTVVLGGTTLGIGLLVGGIIFNATGGKLSGKADEAYAQMKKAEKNINEICNYLKALKNVAFDYNKTLAKVNEKYLECFNFMHYVVNKMNKVDWNTFSDEEKRATENMVLLVGLLYKMCQVKLVKQSENKHEINSININDIDDAKTEAETILKEVA